jgi:hypothetical protein
MWYVFWDQEQRDVVCDDKQRCAVFNSHVNSFVMYTPTGLESSHVSSTKPPKKIAAMQKGAKREIGGRKEDHHQDLGQMFSGDQFEASGKSLEKQCQGIGDHHHPQQLKAKPGTTFDCSCPIAWIHVP